jgi:DNA-binding MarR family transcriptional regulator
MENQLNENDNKLLSFCSDKQRTVGEISDFLKIRPSSVSQRIKKLESIGLLNIYRGGIGKKTFVRTREGDKKENNERKKLMYSYLKEVEKLQPIDVDAFLALNISENHAMAWNRVLFSYPELVKHKLTLTPAGERFIKEFEKSNS